MKASLTDTQDISKPSPKRLLAWYDKNRRSMPWRALKGHKADPYRVWMSEIMLQQTTVATVRPYFEKFIAKWPKLADLAAADDETVRQMWAGLGYYRRARGLHECAKVLVQDFNGVFPMAESDLLALPGIGPYTSAAIRAIAFDQRANVVDGNVERVMARLYAESEPLPKVKKKLKERAEAMLPEARFGDYAQALMDLGATVCTPRQPKCAECPFTKACKAEALGIAEKLPRRDKAGDKPLRRGVAFVLVNKKDQVWIRQRPDQGLLARMMEVPSSDWGEGDFPSVETALKQASVVAKVKMTDLEGIVRHTFTHFDLELKVVAGQVAGKAGAGRWVSLDDLAAEALPSVMRKIIHHALGRLTQKGGGDA